MSAGEGVMMGTAYELRQAANLLRRLSRGADDGPWEQTGKLGSEWNDLVVNETSSGIIADCDTSDENANYIATVHPGVGLALASLLSMMADHALGRGSVCGSCVEYSETIARLVNGVPQ